MAKRLVNPPNLYDGSPLGLSQGTLDGDSGLVFVSGQVDWDQRQQVVHDSVAGQFEAALANVRSVLDAAGARVSDLLHLRIYVRGELEEHMEAVAPILARFLGDARVAITGIGVSSLASRATLVEVESIARVRAL